MHHRNANAKRAAVRAALTAAALLAVASGCGRGRPQATASVIVDNLYSSTCLRPARRHALLARMDQAPPVTVADGAKFQFANLAPGRHTLFLEAKGVSFTAGGPSLVRALDLAPGAGLGVRVTCSGRLALDVSGPQPLP